MRRSAPKSLSSLSLGLERKVKCYNGYFVNGYVFHTEEYGQGRKTYNCGVCVKGSTSSQTEESELIRTMVWSKSTQKLDSAT